jgi:hypothetical protein
MAPAGYRRRPATSPARPRGVEDGGAQPAPLEGLEAGGRGAAGRGDLGPQGGGVLVARLEQAGRAEQGLDREHLRHVSRQPDEDTGLDEALGDEEDVGGPGPGEAGDGVELGLVELDDDPDGLEQRAPPRHVLRPDPGRGGQGGRAEPDDRRRVRHRPQDRHVRADGVAQRRDGHSCGDRQHPSGAGRSQRRAGGGDIAGLHGHDGALGGDGLLDDGDAGEGRLELGAPRRQAFDDRELRRRRPAG